jgi:hypothetical protein
MRLRKAIILSIEVGEILTVLASRYPGLAGITRPPVESAKPFIDVSREARLAELSVADDVDADLGLPPYDFRYRLPQIVGETLSVVRLSADPRSHSLDDFRRPG